MHIIDISWWLLHGSLSGSSLAEWHYAREQIKGRDAVVAISPKITHPRCILLLIQTNTVFYFVTGIRTHLASHA